MGFLNGVWNILSPNKVIRNFFLRSIDGYSITDNIDTSTTQGQYLSYIANPFISTIIDEKTNAFVNGKVFVEKNGVEFTSPDVKMILDLLNKPNGYQSNVEFLKNIYRNCQIFGGAYILPIDLGLSSVKGFSCLLNSCLDIEFDFKSYPFSITKTNFIKRITYTNPYDGHYYDLTEYKDKLIIVKLNEDETKIGQPQSKLVQLNDQINTLNVACDATLNLLRNHGALMMITNRSKDMSGMIPMKPSEKDEFYEDYYKKFGIQGGKNKILFSNHDLNAVKISLPIADLQLGENEKRAVRTISKALGYDMLLLGFPDGSTFNNMNEAKLSLYENTIIPESITLWSGMDVLLKDGNFKAYYDHLEIFQESEKTKAERDRLYIDNGKQLVDNGIYTIEQYKEYLTEKEVI